MIVRVYSVRPKTECNGKHALEVARGEARLEPKASTMETVPKRVQVNGRPVQGRAGHAHLPPGRCISQERYPARVMEWYVEWIARNF